MAAWHGGGSALLKSGSSKLLDLWENHQARRPVDVASIGLVVAGYDVRRIESTVREADRWAAGQPGPVTRCLVLNRRIPVAPEGWIVVDGSNDAREFSAFDEGAAAVLSSVQPDVWVLLNDRHDAYGDSDLRWLAPGVLHLVRTMDVVVGHEDPLGRPIRAQDPTPLRSYLRTNLLAMSESARRKAAPLTSFQITDADDLFPQQWPIAAAAGPGAFHPDYLGWIRTWLTGTGGHTSSWYRATTDPSQLDALRAKAICILNEHTLSQRMVQHGYAVHDVRRAFRWTGLLRHRHALERELEREDRVPADSRRERLRLLLLATARVRWARP